MIFVLCIIPLEIRIFRDFYDSEVRLSKKLFYHRFFFEKTEFKRLKRLFDRTNKRQFLDT